MKTGVSNNVGGVKHFLSTLQHARGTVRHFALVENVTIQPRLARNQVSGQELSPTHASLRSTTSIMITTSNSSFIEEQDAQSITRCWTAHHRDFRAVPRANRTF